MVHRREAMVEEGVAQAIRAVVIVAEAVMEAAGVTDLFFK